MNDVITSLDDATAKRVLDTIAQARLGGRDLETDLTVGIREALQDHFAVTASPGASSEGDLAREALLVLAEDPQVKEQIVAMAEGGATHRFAIGTTLAMTTAALLVLQTYVRFERKESGKWSLVIEKKPTKDGLLKPMVQKLVSLMSGGGT